MNQINFSDNIVRLRHKKKITQEQLADFIGVTKASVSKWENKQSMPDVMLLPRLASFFDVTVDELLGYEPQLSKEQIQKIYRELSADFAVQPFEDVMAKSRDYVKRYYSCYLFLEQICVLWMNHYEIASDEISKQELLKEIENLCEHIITNCKIVRVSNDTMALKATVNLLMGKSAEVIELLEDVTDPTRLASQNNMVLIQAYQMQGDMEKAKSYTQITMYQYLLGMIGASINYLNINITNIDVCKETIDRVKKLIETYEVDCLHPNIAAQFYYQCAIVFSVNTRVENAVNMLELYMNRVNDMILLNEYKLQGDDYFDCLDEWIKKLDLEGEGPRNIKIVAESVCQSLNHPAFTALAGNEHYVKLVEMANRIANNE